MRLVTVQANANFRVLAVTLFTALRAMSARHISERLRNLLVTTDTDRGQRFSSLQIEGQRLMRRVATLAVTDGKMRLVARRMEPKQFSGMACPFCGCTL